MGEEFQGGVCGGNWWNTSPNLFRSSPCSMATINGAGSFGWPNHDHLVMDMNTTRSSDDSTGSPSEDSTLKMMSTSLCSSTASDVWNQDLLHDNGKSDANYSKVLQEVSGMDSNMNYQNNPQISFEDNYSSINSFKQVINQSSTNDYVPTCQELSSTFPLNSASYSLLQTLFDTDLHTEQSLLDNHAINYQINSNEFSPVFPKHEQPASNHRSPNFTNATPSWNATTTAPLSNVCTSFVPSTQPQFIPSTLGNKKPNLPSFSAKRCNEDAKKTSNEPGFKRARMETPSPLPTFKVRKEKLGDRITALQQLVSPFGKTDTASVLHEAIDYIKFLHDQVSVLSAPYLKNGSLSQQRQQGGDKFKNQEAQKVDLKSRGLCLVPISSTFPMAAETTSDFWTPTFSGSFR